MSTEEANIALVRRIFHEGSNVPNPPSVTRDIFAPDFICHGPPGVNHSHDTGMVGPEHCMLKDAFTDVSFTIQEILAEEDRVICRFKADLVQVSEFQGRKPSGRQVAVTGSTTFRVEDSKVKEGWGVLIWE